MFSSRVDLERVVKLLLHELSTATGPHATYDLERDADGNPRVYWTDRELAAADRFMLDVTERPGTYDDAVPRELELRLLRDDAWEPDRDEESP